MMHIYSAAHGEHTYTITTIMHQKQMLQKKHNNADLLPTTRAHGNIYTVLLYRRHQQHIYSKAKEKATLKDKGADRACGPIFARDLKERSGPRDRVGPTRVFVMSRKCSGAPTMRSFAGFVGTAWSGVGTGAPFSHYLSARERGNC